MNIASIDIGSNTTILLIAEVNSNSKKITSLYNLYRVPRICKNLSHENSIPQERIQMLINVLSEFKEIIDKYNCEKIFAIATNAIRIASNGEAIVKEIKKIFDWDIKIIDGATEARYAFLGGTSFSSSVGNKFVIDIGGGSTEIILGNSKEIIFSKSFPLGAVSLTEKYFLNNPPSESEIQLAIEEIMNIFKEVSKVILPFTEVFAVAGTPTTLSCINQNLNTYSEKLVDNSSLTEEEIMKIVEEMIPLTSEEIKKKYGEIVYGRDDILLAGSLILLMLLRITKKNKLTVSGRGIRYGVIIDYLQNGNRF